MKVYVIIELTDYSYTEPFFLSKSDALKACEEIRQSNDNRSDYEVREVDVI